MKISIEVDCTPAEAREFLGLPDVQKLQEEWLEKTREAIMAEGANFTPEQIIKNWTAAAAPNMELMSDLFSSMIKPKPKK